jgi:integrase
MAFVFKPRKSKFWHAGFLDGTGTRRNRSTKTTNRKEAQKFAEEYETAARNKRTSRQVRAVISALHREISGNELVTLTVQEHVNQWIATKKPETAGSTLTFYKMSTKKFVDWLGEKASSEIADITREDILAFRNQEATTLAPKTVNHDLKCLRMLFKAAKRDGLLAEDPTEFVETVRQRSDNPRRPFTIPELKTVLDACDDEWKSMVMFGLYTGQRLSDIAALTWQNVDPEKGEVRLVTRKTGKVLILPMAAPLARHVASLPAGDDPKAPLHPKAFETLTRQGKSGGLSNQFADILAAAGLRPKKSHRKSETGRDSHALSFHCLRATATTLLHAAGVPAAVAQALIGHDSEEIHKVYVKIGSETLKGAAAKLPDVTEIA